MSGNAQKATERQKMEIISALVKASPRILRKGVKGLSHNAAQKWIGDQKLLEEKVTAAVRNALMQITLPSIGRFLGTVKRGVYKTPADFRQILSANRADVEKYAYQILDKVVSSSVEEEVDLWEVTGEELGFTKAVSRKNIYTQAIKLGFVNCSSEDGLLYAFICKDGVWRLIGMDPLEDSGGDPGVFRVSSDGGVPRLDVRHDGPVGLWSSGTRWVFVWPRRK